MAHMQHIKSYTSKLGTAVGYVVQYGCIAHCFLEYVADFVLCCGPSMEPTIYSNNILLSEHLSARFKNVRRGDIVIAKAPNNPNIHICKRVVGLEGDKVKQGFSYHIIPRGCVWLEGDNRENSADSRVYGPVPLGLVRGRAICRVWPPNEVGLLTDRGKWSIVR